ncbi:nitrile hydratase subunit beta [Sulfitobacter geojensis]|uniref:Nitrile hydratase subunit beta n=1 Tax=Sulfitobacter geojensis TaxID=1342299 RepID=A0AAE2W1U3_9RHOB|nr:nitrile hydratase subunit beta [Sulfitobacter geojensis]MBM1691614.1 nitrile hydratase subunit beta [Sulfitobacter geojensis]MBM1695680.1 nitrile hydratase subunit beta [Sulfitobacter geojensis]MBM1707845.1 nitrile hydratase subunit beta [Sulfitobacter geojensis]MBM1711904.1 nitrile hydratase subunit beta [Sulfitobacter geojensis]MBM1715969.1 nitrile hydratase subunit beta [Sulfitobacter geojensis]
MDGVHDLGGKQGHGPIDVHEPVEPFHSEWEARAWALSKSIGGGAPDITIDWWRHVRETTIPVDYLTRPYLDSWLETDMVTLVDSNLCTVEELATGKSATPAATKAISISVADAIAMNRASATDFSRPFESKPKFVAGNQVIAHQNTSPGHTRLPGYVRGRTGKIYEHHGAHLFPDSVAKGIDKAEHLYTVAFAARDLWSESQNSTDVIFLDLWESYLDSR